MGHELSLWFAPLVWLAISLIVLASLTFASTLIYAFRTTNAKGTFALGFLLVSLPAILALLICKLIIPAHHDVGVRSTESALYAETNPEHLEQRMQEIRLYIRDELVPVRKRLQSEIETLRHQLRGMGIRSVEDLDEVEGALPLAIELIEADRILRDIDVAIKRHEAIAEELQASLRRATRSRLRPDELLDLNESLKLRAVIRILNEEATLSSGVSDDDLAKDFETILNRSGGLR